MKKQTISEDFKRIYTLAFGKKLINENYLNGLVVYAASDSSGMFEELVVLDKKDIIDDSEETEDGAFICIYKKNGKKDEFYYIDKIE